jgi:hypothetical protein
MGLAGPGIAWCLHSGICGIGVIVHSLMAVMSQHISC